MSLVNIEEVFDDVDRTNDLETSKGVVQCCDKHFLVNSKIEVINADNLNYINFHDLNSSLRLNQLQSLILEKDRLIANLERENLFLKEQVKSLNLLLDQLSAATRNMATKNDIRIRVENSGNVLIKKWYRRPKVILSGSAVAVLFSIYLRYKIKNWLI